MCCMIIVNILMYQDVRNIAKYPRRNVCRKYLNLRFIKSIGVYKSLANRLGWVLWHIHYLYFVRQV